MSSSEGRASGGESITSSLLLLLICAGLAFGIVSYPRALPVYSWPCVVRHVVASAENPPGYVTLMQLSRGGYVPFPYVLTAALSTNPLVFHVILLRRQWG